MAEELALSDEVRHRYPGRSATGQPPQLRALRDGQLMLGVAVEPFSRTPEDVCHQDLGIEPG
jgi:hypothetical protein